MNRAARADNPDRMLIALLKFAQDIQNDRRRVDLAQGFWIRWRVLDNDARAEVFNPFQLRRKIDNRLPIRNLIRDFAADPLDFAKLGPFRGQNCRRLLENL